jgi:hypothetical protein
MDPVKVVVRYIDGKVSKGFTLDFFPNKEEFHLQSLDKSAGSETQKISIKELKGVFFVKDFKGNPSYSERQTFSEGERVQGRKIVVFFKDGERLAGTTMGYDPKRSGFFVAPIDSQGNNIRAYIVQASVDKVNLA